MIVFVYDRFGEQKATLHEFVEFYHEQELGSFDIVDIVIPGEKVEKGDYLLWKGDGDIWHENIVSSETSTHENGLLLQSIHAPNSILETNRNTFIRNSYYTSSAQRRALTDLLSNTRWDVGIVDDISSRQLLIKNETVYEGISDLYNVTREESYFTTDISVGESGVTKRVLNFVKNIGVDTGLLYTYGFDAESVERTVDIDEVYTRIYCYGAKIDKQIPDDDKDIYARYGQEDRITIRSLQGTDYVEDNAAKLKYGTVDRYGNIQHSEGVFYFDDLYTYSSLYYAAWRKLNEVKVPRVTYKAKIYDIIKKKYGVNPLGLGDVIMVRDDELGDTIVSRVVRIKRDYINENNTDIELGNTTRTFK